MSPVDQSEQDERWVERVWFGLGRCGHSSTSAAIEGEFPRIHFPSLILDHCPLLGTLAFRALIRPILLGDIEGVLINHDGPL